MKKKKKAEQALIHLVHIFLHNHVAIWITFTTGQHQYCPWCMISKVYPPSMSTVPEHMISKAAPLPCFFLKKLLTL